MLFTGLFVIVLGQDGGGAVQRGALHPSVFLSGALRWLREEQGRDRRGLNTDMQVAGAGRNLREGKRPQPG